MDQARIDAKALGEKVYEGKECQRGHGTTRYVSTGGCIECGRASALAAYHKRRDRLLAVEVREEPKVVLPEKFDDNTVIAAVLIVESFADE